MREEKIKAIANILANHDKVRQWYEMPFRFVDMVRLMTGLRTVESPFPLHVALAGAFFEEVDHVPFYHMDVRAYMYGVRGDENAMWNIIDNTSTNLKGIAEMVDVVYNGGFDEMEQFLRWGDELSLRNLLTVRAGEEYCRKFMECL